jgi:carbonic anhydrase
MRLLLLFTLYSIAVFPAILGYTPAQALQRLIDGNGRYAEGKPLHADHSPDRRNAVLKKQTPFATIVSCSDSRVTPEIIFDQGVGEIFVVRVAGNVAGPIELDSVDYSIKALGSPLIVILGHESCGAIKAVIEKNTADIEELAALIQPAVKDIKNLERAIKANVRYVVGNFKKNPFVQKLMKDRKLDCIGGYYNISTGKVEILSAKKDDL